MDINHNNNQNLPDINTLLPTTRRVIRTLEGLLRVHYPHTSLRNSNEARRRPIVRELTVLLYALYHHNNRDEAHDLGVVRTWLGLTPENIPTEAQTLSRIQQPHLTQQLFANGLAHYAMPMVILQADRPYVTNIEIEDPMTRITLHGNQETPYSIIGNNIFQAHFTLTTTINMLTGAITYDLIIRTGHEAVPCSLLYDRDSWGRTMRPPSLSVVAYNATGISFPPVRDYISSLTGWYRPHLVFITDARLPPTEAQEFANLLQYNLVTTLDSIQGTGGVWILSEPNRTVIQMITETETQIRFNMQPTMARQNYQ